MDERLSRLADDVAHGRRTPAEVLELLTEAGAEGLAFAELDRHRAHRQGMPEVVYGAGKSADQIVAIVDRLKTHGHPVLITRLTPEAHGQCAGRLDADTPGDYDALSRTWTWGRQHVRPLEAGSVAVVSAGTSDLAVAEEAARTAELFGCRVVRLVDVGVAGLHRLLARLDELREARVVIAVAGMEGALPSVVAGLVSSPVVAVPTSVGYGASFGGVAALLAMLNSCASGVTVVNIDNGFGAACAATRILQSSPTADAPAADAAPGHARGARP